MACQCGRLAVTVAVAAAAGWASCARQAAPLDAAAAGYVRLASALARHDSDFLEGPAGGSVPALGLQAIVDEAGRLRRRLRSVNGDDGRRAFLVAQITALERRARFVGGQPMSIEAEARALGLPVPGTNASRVAALLAELDAALPGSGTRFTRLAAHRRATAVPRASLDAVARTAADACRTRTSALGEPAGGRVEFRFVIDRPWAGFTTYQGDGTSLVELRRDAALDEDEWLALVCHETWPGHHVQYLVWDQLRRSRGWSELAIAPRFTPHGVMAERAAAAATALVVPPASRPAVGRILGELAPFALAAAIEQVDGRGDRTGAVRRLRDEFLMPDAEGFLAFVERFRSMAVAYVSPLPAVRRWDDYLALLRAPERLANGDAQ